MFETSIVRVEAARVAAGRVSMLTISIAVHTAAIAGAIAAGIATTEFPRTAPDQYVRVPAFVPVSVPPPLGNPNGGAVRPQQPQQQTPPPQRAEVTAPQLVPETIVPATGSGEGVPAGEEGSGSVAGPVGVPWGVEGGLGELDAPPVGATVEPVRPEIHHVGGEVKAPVLVHRVDPAYPAVMSRNRVPATVVVRCVIDRNGRVRDPEIVVPALPPFNEAVLAAVRQWRYTPGSLRGTAVEVYLELSVRFHTR